MPHPCRDVGDGSLQDKATPCMGLPWGYRKRPLSLEGWGSRDAGRALAHGAGAAPGWEVMLGDAEGTGTRSRRTWWDGKMNHPLPKTPYGAGGSVQGAGNVKGILNCSPMVRTSEHPHIWGHLSIPILGTSEHLHGQGHLSIPVFRDIQVFPCSGTSEHPYVWAIQSQTLPAPRACVQAPSTASSLVYPGAWLHPGAADLIPVTSTS